MDELVVHQPESVPMTPGIGMVAVDSLIPYARNARTHSDDQAVQVFGNSLHAVKLQIWISVCVYLIALIAHKELGMKISKCNLPHLSNINMPKKIALK